MYSVKCLAHLPWNLNKVKTVLLGCRTPKMQHTNPRFKEGYTCRWLQTSPLVGLFKREHLLLKVTVSQDQTLDTDNSTWDWLLKCAFSQFADSDISPSLRIQMWGTHWEAPTHVCWIDWLSFTRVERIVKEPILPPLEVNPNYKKWSLDHTEQIWIHF